MQVKDVARIGFSARGATQQQGDLAIGHRLFGQIVINDERIFTAVPVVLTHGAARKGRKVLHCCGIGSVGRHHDGVLHGPVLLQLTHHRSNRGSLLANGNIDTLNASALLVDDRVNRNSGFTHLPVTDDQFPLTPANRHHGVDGLQANLHRLVNGLSGNNPGGDLLDSIGLIGINAATAINGVTQGINHPALQSRSHRHFQNTARAATGLTLGKLLVVTQNHRAH